MGFDRRVKRNQRRRNGDFKGPGRALRKDWPGRSMVIRECRPLRRSTKSRDKKDGINPRDILKPFQRPLIK